MIDESKGVTAEDLYNLKEPRKEPVEMNREQRRKVERDEKRREKKAQSVIAITRKKLGKALSVFTVFKHRVFDS